MTNLFRRSVTAVFAALAIVAGGVAASAQDKVGVITDAGFLGGTLTILSQSRKVFTRMRSST